MLLLDMTQCKNCRVLKLIFIFHIGTQSHDVLFLNMTQRKNGIVLKINTRKFTSELCRKLKNFKYQKGMTKVIGI